MSIRCSLRSTAASPERRRRDGYNARSWFVTGGQAMRANEAHGEAFDCSTFYNKRGLKRALRQTFGKTCRAY